MTDLVKTHLQQWARGRFVWGKTDCCLALADYVQAVTGIDGAAHLRGKYHDRVSLDELTGWAIDPVAVIDDCTVRVALEATDTPRRGDIALMNVAGHVVGGICLGDKFGIKAVRGVLIKDLSEVEVLKAWRVPC